MGDRGAWTADPARPVQALLVGLPSYRDLEDGDVEAAEYRGRVRASDHVRPVDGVDYDQVTTEHLPPSPTSAAREAPGKRRPSE